MFRSTIPSMFHRTLGDSGVSAKLDRADALREVDLLLAAVVLSVVVFVLGVDARELRPQS